jgi:hypothetical protein
MKEDLKRRKQGLGVEIARASAVTFAIAELLASLIASMVKSVERQARKGEFLNHRMTVPKAQSCFLFVTFASFCSNSSVCHRQRSED